MLRFLFNRSRRDQERKSSVLDLGNLARDNKQWATAASLYEKHLMNHHDDYQIWTQLGNTSKEAALQALEVAQQAYMRSIDIVSSEADAWMQMGHLLKVRGRLEEARSAYRRCAQIDPNYQEIQRELEDISKRIEAISSPQATLGRNAGGEALLGATLKDQMAASEKLDWEPPPAVANEQACALKARTDDLGPEHAQVTAEIQCEIRGNVMPVDVVIAMAEGSAQVAHAGGAIQESAHEILAETAATLDSSGGGVNEAAMINLRVSEMAQNDFNFHSSIVLGSGLFDEYYYANRYEIKEKTPTAAIEHYLLWGYREGKSPHPLFDLFHFHKGLAPNDRGGEPIAHYLARGGNCTVSPSEYFDAEWYVASYPEVASQSLPPLVHYLRIGHLKEYRPLPYFDVVGFKQRRKGVDFLSCSPLYVFVRELSQWDNLAERKSTLWSFDEFCASKGRLETLSAVCNTFE
ncbi:MAG: tetratricopeptide repeat protein [Alphaproteobacteria bacterium]|nr:tetratricopeptide repeat protein [Alphaproteobacteria bacterium]